MQNFFDEKKEDGIGLSKKDDLSHGIAKLVLTILETLRQLMEQQATHRINDGSLTEAEVERLGLAFEKLDNKITEIASQFGLMKKDLQLALTADQTERGDGPLFSLVDLLDRVIEKGLVVFGDLGISVADVELINVQLRLIVSSTGRIRRNASNAKSEISQPSKDGDASPVLAKMKKVGNSGRTRRA